MATLDEMKTAGEALAGNVPEEAIEIEVVDDTPTGDQNRVNLSPRQVAEVENDDLAEYSEQARNRLGQLKKVWHDERRAKETATREREEALNYARAKDGEIKSLREKLGRGEQIFVTEISKAATGEIATAKERLKRAYEAGDADAIADAQEELTDAKFKLRDVQSIQPSLQAEPSGVQPEPQQQAPARVPDQKAETWRSRNTWFGVDKEMTSYAFGLHEKLVDDGVDPRSDEYYEKVDARIRKLFPEQFDEVEETERDKPAQRAKPATVVASVTRTTGPKRIRLTASQLSIAKRLNLTPEMYAREMIKLENSNG